MTFLFHESSEEVGLCRQERRQLTPFDIALLEEAGALSVVNGVPVEPEVTVGAVEIMLVNDAGNSISLVVSLSCTELAESPPLES